MKLDNNQLVNVKEEVEKVIVKNVFDIYNYQEVYEDLNNEELKVLQNKYAYEAI